MDEVEVQQSSAAAFSGCQSATIIQETQHSDFSSRGSNLVAT